MTRLSPSAFRLVAFRLPCQAFRLPRVLWGPYVTESRSFRLSPSASGFPSLAALLGESCLTRTYRGILSDAGNVLISPTKHLFSYGRIPSVP